jgi:hypothetical protein
MKNWTLSGEWVNRLTCLQSLTTLSLENVDVYRHGQGSNFAIEESVYFSADCLNTCLRLDVLRERPDGSGLASSKTPAPYAIEPITCAPRAAKVCSNVFIF